jgi:hypothetical protein
MNWQLLIPLLVTTAVAIIGWFAAHSLTVQRDRANKRREERVNALISAYQRLFKCCELKDQSDLYSRAELLESAIADIQLFGNFEQVQAVEDFVATMIRDKTANIHSLLMLLRRDLRKELRLPIIARDLTWIRVQPPDSLEQPQAGSHHS